MKNNDFRLARLALGLCVVLSGCYGEEIVARIDRFTKNEYSFEIKRREGRSLSIGDPTENADLADQVLSVVIVNKCRDQLIIEPYTSKRQDVTAAAINIEPGEEIETFRGTLGEFWRAFGQGESMGTYFVPFHIQVRIRFASTNIVPANPLVIKTWWQDCL